MIKLIPFNNKKYKDLYVESMKLLNEEVDPRQFIKDNYYHSLVEAIYMHCFEELEKNLDLSGPNGCNTSQYALNQYVDAAVETYSKIRDLNGYFELNTSLLDEGLVIYIAGQFANYFNVNHIDNGETEESFAGKMLDRLSYSAAFPFKRKRGERYGVQEVEGIYVHINDLIYKSKKRNDKLASDMGWSLEDIKLLRAGRVRITKDVLHMLFLALRLTSKEAKNFLKKIKSDKELGLKAFTDNRDELLFNILDDMIWYRNLPDHRGKRSITIANLLLEANRERLLDPGVIRQEKEDGVRTILLTGGFGFIGQNCIQYFNRLTEENKDGIRYRVCVLNRSIPQKLPENVICYYGDINNELMYERIISECEVDYIIHLAAISTVSQGAEGLCETFDVNSQSANYIYNTVKRNSFPVKCIVLPSTTRVYKGLFGNDPVCMESSGIDLKKIKNVYDRSKYIAEGEAEMFAVTAKVPVIIARLSNIYGKGDRNKRLIPETIRRLDEGEVPRLYIDKESRRTELLNFLYVEDLVKAFGQILEKVESGDYQYDPHDIVFNVGSQQSYYVSDVVNMLIEIMGKDCEPVYEEGTFGAERLLSVKKAEETFGIRAATDIRKGLEETVKWYLETKEEKK